MSYQDLLIDISRHDKYVVMTSENRAAIRELPHLLGDRFIDVGIAEQAMIGMAAGLALRGRVPIVHALSAFLTMRAFEFIRTDVGLPCLPVKLIGSMAGFLSTANGPTHQAIEDIALMRGIPHMTIFCPADEQDMLIGLPQVLASPHPCYVRFTSQPAFVPHLKDFETGQAEVISDGNDVALVTYGLLAETAWKVTAILREMNISTRLINLRSLKPIDEDCISKAATDCRLLVTLEDHFITGGLHSIVAELFLNSGITTKVLPVALQDKSFRAGKLEDVMKFEGFSSQNLVKEISHALERL